MTVVRFMSWKSTRVARQSMGTKDRLVPSVLTLPPSLKVFILDVFFSVFGPLTGSTSLLPLLLLPLLWKCVVRSVRIDEARIKVQLAWVWLLSLSPTSLLIVYKFLGLSVPQFHYISQRDSIAKWWHCWKMPNLRQYMQNLQEKHWYTICIWCVFGYCYGMNVWDLGEKGHEQASRVWLFSNLLKAKVCQDWKKKPQIWDIVIIVHTRGKKFISPRFRLIAPERKHFHCVVMIRNTCEPHPT